MGKEFRHELREEGPEDVGSYGFGSVVARVLGRAHAALTFTLAVLVAFGAFVPRAFAANQYNPEMVIDGADIGDNVGSKGYMCVNANRFTATLELIGKMGDYVSIDNEKYTRLITSGPFKDCMDGWNELTGSANEEAENTWLGGDGFVDGWLIISGRGNCWYGTFTDAEKALALQYYSRVMSGEDTGGSSGGSGETTPDGWWRGGYLNGNTFTLVAVGDNNDGDESEYTVDSELMTWIESKSTSSSSVAICEDKHSNGSFDVYHVYFYVLPAGVHPKHDGLQGQISFYNTNSSSKSLQYYRYESTRTHGETIRKSDCRYATYTVSGHMQWIPINPGSDTYEFWAAYDWSEGSSEPEPEPEEKPEPEPDVPGPSPTAPDPPDLPDIGDPVVPHEPDPTSPTTEPTPPTLPTPITVTVPTNTSPADYTPWLRAILEELKNINAALNSYLQSIIDEMAEHCQHIRDEMGVQATYLGECLDSVASAAAGVGDQLENALHDYSEWLSEYLDGLAEWMVEHMSFNSTVENNVTADPYDDTSLMYWIKRIYTKLGAGSPVNSRPKDPVTNPTETNTWWEELWQKILKELANMFPNLAIDLGLIFDDLKGKFPFSIPWDLHALLLLMVTDPVAPHVQIPAYALTADMELEQVATYDMDFDVYTPYMTGIHLMFEVAWVGYLLSKTKDYMQLIEGVIPS